jgi:hypothetical protein
MKTKITVNLLFILLFVCAGSALAFTESTSSFDNDYFGYSTGGTGGLQNSFFGAYAGDFNTGSENTFMGYLAGYGNSTGYENTFIGNHAGYGNSTGNDNTFIGAFTGSGGSFNSFFGAYAGFHNDGANNTFLGYETGYNNTTGNANIFIGNWAGYDNTIGIENTFIGNWAGNSNTEGNSNTFIGYTAGYHNINGNANTFIGHGAGNNNSDGFDNTFLGYTAGFNNTVGYNNTFIGYHAGHINTWGIDNTFLGWSSGFNNISGYSNTFLGFDSGYHNTSGFENTFVGNRAGYSNSTGTGNVFLGYNAGYNETGSSRLYIDNSPTPDPLIYGEFDNDLVRINGQLTVGSVIESTSGGIKFPDGSVLTSANTIDADTLDGLHSGAFALSAHLHSGEDIADGTVAEARIDTAITRDDELNAHTSRIDNPHSVTAEQVGAADVSHNHDADYVNITGDVMTGDLIVEGDIQTDYDLYVHGNTYVDSDETLKEDIKPIDSSLEKVLGLRGVSYTWKKEKKRGSAISGRTHYGVIAQQVETMLPEIVKQGNDGVKKVAYMELIPVLIEAMKEQQTIYDNKFKHQQKIIFELLNKVERLEREIKLKNTMALVDIH